MLRQQTNRIKKENKRKSTNKINTSFSSHIFPSPPVSFFGPLILTELVTHHSGPEQSQRLRPELVRVAEHTVVLPVLVGGW